MLVLTRRLDENIIIGDDIVITVLKIIGKEVRLGVTAPKNVTIDREEIHNRKRSDHGSVLDNTYPAT